MTKYRYRDHPEPPMNAIITDKQYKIMVVICEGNKDSNGKVVSPVDIDELLERVAYTTTKASMQFSIRALIRRGLIIKGQEHRRGRLRTTLLPTPDGRATAGYHDPHYIESDEDFSHLDV